MKHIQLFEDFLNEAKMPDKYIGNDEIVFLKTKEDSKGAHYNLYYKGHDIDVGGRRFGNEKQLKDFADDYILSNQLYNKLKYKDAKPLPESVNEAFINEENWSSSPNKPIIHEKELASFFEGLIKFNSASKNIIKQYNLQPSIEVEGYHFTDNTGAIYFNYKLGHSAVKLKVGLGSIGETNPILLIKSWSGEGALSKPNELRTPIALKANVMSELTLAMIQKEIKKAAPVFNKYLNNTIDKWANGVAAQKAFYKDRKGSSGVGDLA